MSELEIVDDPTVEGIRAALFDFDGTISVLRRGWEEVMADLMIETLSSSCLQSSDLDSRVREYIEKSKGIATIEQMKWLAARVEEYGLNENIHDPARYLEEYTRRLERRMAHRKRRITEGRDKPRDYMIFGVCGFLDELLERDIQLFLASGTAHPDLIEEAALLGVDRYFAEMYGAPTDGMGMNKCEVFKKIESEISDTGKLLVVGDGSTEISLGREGGAVTLGVASNEIERYGIHGEKRLQLIAAGAHAIVGDFKDARKILAWLGLDAENADGGDRHWPSGDC